MIAGLIFNIPVDRCFSYRVPDEMQSRCRVGCRAVANFHGRDEIGIIITLKEERSTSNFTLFAESEPDYQNDIKDIQELLDPFPVITSEQIQLSEWMSNYYLSSQGEALFKMFPSPPKSFSKSKSTLHKEKQLKKKTPHPDHILNQEQRVVFDAVASDMKLSVEGKRNHASFHLLHGVTGSGKTEIYIHLIDLALRMNQGAFLLVPEITLTVQMVERLEKVFGTNLALLHSALTGTVRFKGYLSLLKGEAAIAVGTRSAVFAPVKSPLLFILDEEHDSSYKEGTHPRYDARRIACRRAEITNGVVLFASATPALESRYHAFNHDSSFRLTYHHLSHRATGASLPSVRIIRNPSFDQPVTGTMIYEIDQNRIHSKQTILLLNRRGYHPYLYCPKCKSSVQCPSCSVSLTLHKNGNLLCHYCGYRQDSSDACPVCGTPLQKQGFGTQKLEEVLLRRFPDLKIERLDTDAVTKREIVEKVIRKLLDGGLDLLLGTQMIAKGLDAPSVTLVGVLRADHLLGMPDFRASERTFALLTQVAGRAGRGRDPGRVIFEALNPDHPVLRYAAMQNYDSFYEDEIRIRQEAYYPPFCRILRLLGRGEDEELVMKEMDQLALKVREEVELFDLHKGNRLLGPVKAPIEKIDTKYRVHIIIKSDQMESLMLQITPVVERVRKGMKSYLEIDIDPVDLF